MPNPDGSPRLLGTAPSENPAQDADAQLAALLGLQHWALQNPYPIYRRLREESPVHHQHPIVFVSKYDDVLAGLKDHLRLANAQDGARREHILASLESADRDRYLEIDGYVRRQMPRLDAPEHAPNREIAHRALTPRWIAAMKETVQNLIDELLEPLSPGYVVDFVEMFAYQLPMLVIFEMIGVPRHHRALVRSWGEDIMRHRANPTDPNLLRRSHQSHQAFAALVREILAAHRRRDNPTHLLSGLLAAQTEGRADAEDLVSMLMLLLFAGHETTTNLLGSGLLALIRNPEQWAQLQMEPSRIPSAVEEMLRFDAPIQHVPRTAVVDFELRGVEIRRGQTIFLSVAAANRDPDRFSDPDRFDVGRETNRHLTFGFGIHFCIGAALARLEAQLAFSALTSRYAAVELADHDLIYQPSLTLRGLSRLPIRFSRVRATGRPKRG